MALTRKALGLVGALVLGASMLAAEPVTISGTVVDGEGDPVAEAQVWVLDYEVDEETYQTKAAVVAAGRTNAEGTFSLAEVDWPDDAPLYLQFTTVVAHKPGLALGWRLIRQPSQPVEVTLLEPEPVRGSVLDLEGKPIAGAQVKLQYASMPEQGEGPSGEWFMATPEMLASLSTATDEEGAFAFEALPPGVRVGVEVQAAGRGTVEAWGDRERALALRLGGAARLSGRFTCPEPAQAAGLKLRLFGTYPAGARVGEGDYGVPQVLTADEQGRFAIEELPPARYQINVVALGGHKWQAQEVKPLQVGAGEQIDDFEIELVRAWPVKGRVIDAETEEPVADAPVVGSARLGPTSASARTDENGAYLLHLLPGKAFVSVGAVGGYYQETEGGQSITVSEGQEVTVEDFRLRRVVSIKGIVVNDADELVAGAEVWEEGLRRWRRGPETVSDEQGMFELRGLPSGEVVRIYATSENAVSPRPVGVNTSEQEGMIRIVVSERAASRVIGRVVDDRGTPVTGARITILRHETRTYDGGTYETTAEGGQAQTDNEGRFESRVLLPDVSYSVHVGCEGYAPAEGEQWEAAQGEIHDLGEIVLTGAHGRLAGVVLDPEGKPLAGVEVFNAGDGPQRASTVTDGEGRFELTGIFEGYAYAFAEAPGYRFAGVRAETEAEDVRIVLRPADRPRPEAPGNPPVVDLDRDRKLAEEVALEGLEMTRGTRWGEREQLLGPLARVNPERATELRVQQGIEGERDLLEGLADALLATKPDQAIDRTWAAEDGFTRAYALNDLGRKLMPRNPELAAEAFSLAASAARAMGTEGWGVASLGRAARGLLELGRPEGREVADEAFSLAQERGYEEWEDRHTRGIVAVAMSLVDLDAALSLLVKGPDGRSVQEHDRHLDMIACVLASRDPDKAEEALSHMRGGLTRMGGDANIAYEMFARDPERALEFARKARSASERALAVGYLALRFAEQDRERAFELIEEAVGIQAAEQGKVFRGGYRAATYVARLAQVAAQIGYPDVAGIAMRAMSLRPDPQGGLEREGEGEGEEIARLAACLAWTDTEAARHLLAPLVGDIETYLEAGYGVAGKIVVAAAVVDPEWALEMARGLPDDDEVKKRPKVFSYVKLAEHLSLAPEDRLREIIDFWMPGKGEW
jgi:protocatechuate 3,4-dioxygenase beta subunit